MPSPSEGQEKQKQPLPHIQMTWGEVEEAVSILLGQLKEDGFVPEMIVGVGKGGIIPAVLLHQQIPSARFETIQIQSYSGMFSTGPKIVGAVPNIPNLEGVLIVDDILETGTTRDYLQLMYPKATFAFMVCRQKMAGTCKYRGKIYTPGWVDFPWERKLTATEVAF